MFAHKGAALRVALAVACACAALALALLPSAVRADLSWQGADQYHYPLLAFQQKLPPPTTPASHVPFTAACAAAAQKVRDHYRFATHWPGKMLGVMIVTPPAATDSSSTSSSSASGAPQKRLYVATSGSAKDDADLASAVYGGSKPVPVTLKVGAGSDSGSSSGSGSGADAAEVEYRVTAYGGSSAGHYAPFSDKWNQQPSDGYPRDACTGTYTRRPTASKSDAIQFDYSPGPCSARDVLERRACLVDYAAALADPTTSAYGAKADARYKELAPAIHAFADKQRDAIAAAEKALVDEDAKHKAYDAQDEQVQKAALAHLDADVAKAQADAAKAAAAVTAAEADVKKSKAGKEKTAAEAKLRKARTASEQAKGAVVRAQNTRNAGVSNAMKKHADAEKLRHTTAKAAAEKSLAVAKAQRRPTTKDPAPPSLDAGLQELADHADRVHGACHGTPPPDAVKNELRAIVKQCAMDDVPLSAYVDDARKRLQQPKLPAPKEKADEDESYPYGACAGTKLAMLAQRTLDTRYTIDCIAELWTGDTHGVRVTPANARTPTLWTTFVPSCSTCRVAMAGLLSDRKSLVSAHAPAHNTPKHPPSPPPPKHAPHTPASAPKANPKAGPTPESNKNEL